MHPPMYLTSCLLQVSYGLASLSLMLFVPHTVSGACIYSFIYILRILITYRLASLFLLLFIPRTVSAACIYASIYVFGVLFAYRLTATQESLNLRKHPRRDGCTGKPQAPPPNNAISFVYIMYLIYVYYYVLAERVQHGVPRTLVSRRHTTLPDPAAHGRMGVRSAQPPARPALPRGGELPEWGAARRPPRATA
jgi:hypothetical protein